MDHSSLKPKLSNLPYLPGCYLMKDSRNEIIYVGKAVKLHSRVNQYFVGTHDFKTSKMVSNIADFDFIVTASEKEALVLEINLIKKYRPKYNIMFIDDSSYPYIKLTKEKYPILTIARDMRKDRKAKYFGPFPDVTAAKTTLKLLQSMYHFRRCRVMPDKVCLYYHMHQCLGPCQYDIDPKIYEQMGAEVTQFLNGDIDKVVKDLEQKMLQASEELQFEKAAEYKNLLQSVQEVISRQMIEVENQKDIDVFAWFSDKGYLAIQGFFVRHGTILEKAFRLSPLYGDASEEFISFILQYYENHPHARELVLPQGTETESLEEILQTRITIPQKGYRRKLIQMCLQNAQKQLQIKFEMVQKQEQMTIDAVEKLSSLAGQPMNRIELFDNSHISGAFTVAACVVYEDGLPDRKSYRLYKLHTGNSDVDSMKEVIYRRYFRMIKENSRLPDAILVDGGSTQIEAAESVIDSLQLNIRIMGLVKDDTHTTDHLLDENGNILPVQRDSSLFFLLTRMQDEVHRTAISYHRKLRQKAQTRSILDEIEGIGPKRKKMLLKAFGNFTGLKVATAEQIAEIVPLEIAQRVYAAIHTEDELT